MVQVAGLPNCCPARWWSCPLVSLEARALRRFELQVERAVTLAEPPEKPGGMAPEAWPRSRRAPLFTHSLTHTYLHTYLLTCTHTYIHTYAHTCIWIHMQKHCTHMHVCMFRLPWNLESRPNKGETTEDPKAQPAATPSIHPP